MNKSAYFKMMGLKKKAAKYNPDYWINEMGSHPQQYNWDDSIVNLEQTKKYRYELARLFRLLRNKYGNKASADQGLTFSLSRYSKSPVKYTDFSKNKTADVAVTDPQIVQAAKEILNKTKLGQIGINLYKQKEDAQGFPRWQSQFKDYLA